MAKRPRLSIVSGSPAKANREPQRERETIGAEIKQLETILRKCAGKPGYAQRVEATKQRLEECRGELERLVR